MKNLTSRARQHLIAAGKEHPGIWRLFDDFRAEKGKGDPRDFLRESGGDFLALAGDLVGGRHGRKAPIRPIGGSALAAWRTTQGVYRFDPDLMKALIETPMKGPLPSEVLNHIPEWCVYVETPGITWVETPIHGFFAHLEWDVGYQRQELRLLLDSDLWLIPVPIHLGPWTLDEAIERSMAVAKDRMPAQRAMGETERFLKQASRPMISLLLYLCSENAEIIGDGHPQNPEAKKTRKGPRLFPPDQPRAWDVGVRIGAALRRATSQPSGGDTGGGSPKRPHIRRAHWHTYAHGEGR